MLFKREHIQKIKNRQKTQTRRRISRFKKGPKKGKVVPPRKVGSIQPCQTSFYSKVYCYIKILKLWCERLGDISKEDAFAEGQYTQEDYVSGLIGMYKNSIDENEVLWCYELEYVEDENQREKLEV